MLVWWPRSSFKVFMKLPAFPIWTSSAAFQFRFIDRVILKRVTYQRDRRERPDSLSSCRYVVHVLHNSWQPRPCYGLSSPRIISHRYLVTNWPCTMHFSTWFILVCMKNLKFLDESCFARMIYSACSLGDVSFNSPPSTRFFVHRLSVCKRVSGFKDFCCCSQAYTSSSISKFGSFHVALSF